MNFPPKLSVDVVTIRRKPYVRQWRVMNGSLVRMYLQDVSDCDSYGPLGLVGGLLRLSNVQ